MKKILATLILFLFFVATASADDYSDQHEKAKETGLVWVIVIGEDW